MAQQPHNLPPAGLIDTSVRTKSHVGRETLIIVFVVVLATVAIIGATFFAGGAPMSSNSVVLAWTSPGDDGTIGQAASYDVRYSKNPITASNFSAAPAATGESAPQSAGRSETFTVKNLTAGTTYYFAIKSTDEFGNLSAMSNVVTKTTTSRGTTSQSSGSRKK